MNIPHESAAPRCAWIVILAAAGGCAVPAGAPRATEPALEPFYGTIADQTAAQAQVPAPTHPSGTTAPQETQALPEQPAAGAPAAKAKSAPSPLSGWLKSRYRLRTAGSDSDHDWYETLALDYADPAHPELAAHFLGRTAVDLDGNSGLLLESSNDLQNGSLDADMYEGYVDAGTKKGDLRVRMGRQSDYLTPEIAHFDGVSVRTLKEDGPHPYEFGAYGGGNVTYDSTSNIDDGVFGVYAESRAWKGGRARLDWMHLNDAALLGADNNDLLGVSLFQNFKAWSASGKYTSLEGRDRDAELRARWADAAGKTSVQLRYFELLEPQNQRALFLDPFTQSLQTYFPYHQIGISGWRALSEKVDLDLGVDLREVNDPGDVGTFNHDWQRYYTTLTLRDLIPYAWTASVTADYYDDKQNDFKTLGADLSHPLASDWDLSLGTYYSLYKYDFFSATERDDVRTYFGKVVWRRSETWTFELLYEYEDDNLEQYNTLRCGALCRF